MITEIVQNEINVASDMVLIRTIENHKIILYQIEQGVKSYNKIGRGGQLVEAELAAMEAELNRRYPKEG